MDGGDACGVFLTTKDTKDTKKCSGREGDSAFLNLSFWVTSFPRRRETSAAMWISACAGMTVNPNFKSVKPNFRL